MTYALQCWKHATRLSHPKGIYVDVHSNSRPNSAHSLVQKKGLVARGCLLGSYFRRTSLYLNIIRDMKPSVCDYTE